uniref:Uncharacterized protein n=1 Tax=Vespula pensylvanica TaxID=30213 RepID=A0A834UH17_VESPE|nr:hypothetical protein H0235_001083 [Vespula pensylvanica]
MRILQKSVTFEKSIIIEKHQKELEKERRRNDKQVIWIEIRPNILKEESNRISISDPASGDFSIEANEINLVQRDIRNLVESNQLKAQLEIQFGETFSVQSNYTEFSHRKQRVGEDLAALIADLANFHNLRIWNVQQRYKIKLFVHIKDCEVPKGNCDESNSEEQYNVFLAKLNRINKDGQIRQYFRTGDLRREGIKREISEQTFSEIVSI